MKSFFRKNNSLYALKYAYFTHKKSFFRYMFGRVISYTMLGSFYTVAMQRIRKKSCLNFSNTLLHFFSSKSIMHIFRVCYRLSQNFLRATFISLLIEAAVLFIKTDYDLTIISILSFNTLLVRTLFTVT